MNRLQSLARPAVRSAFPFDSALINGLRYPLLGLNTTLSGKVEPIDPGYVNLATRVYAGNPIVYACEMARIMLFTEARFQFQNMRGGRPGDFWGDRDRPDSRLAILERPWPGGTTGDLLKYVLLDHDLAGNAFVLRRGDRLLRLRPDWTTIIHGTNDPDGSMWDVDAELLGYGYQAGGTASGKKPVFFDASQVAHFAPSPDPLSHSRGMPWMVPVIREIVGDEAMADHKLKFFEHGGGPSLVVKTQYTDPVKFREWGNMFRQEHEGVANAYKTMLLSSGVDVSVVGSDLQQVDFKVVQGAGEVRIANAAGVPATVVGLSEGLQGSSLNAGNFGSSMRRFADLTMRPLWRNIAGSLEQIVPPPSGTRLWIDDRDIPALKDDIKDAAEVQNLQAQAVHTYVIAGFEPASVVDAINAGDIKRLVHTGLFSVQLQPPMPDGPPQPEGPPEPASPPVALPDEPSSEDAAPAREQLLLLARQTEAHERRADAAERMAEREWEPQTPTVVNVTVPEQPVTVTIEEGAVQVSAPVTVEAPVVNVAPPEVTIEPAQVLVSENAIQVVEHVPMQTIIDRDPETGVVTGSHEVPVPAEEPSE
jgi:hypothetical protein